MISILIVCFSRQDNLDKVLPMWLNQEGDYEILLSLGPDMKCEDHPKVRKFYTDKLGLCHTWNRLLNEANGDAVLFAHSDMAIPWNGWLNEAYSHLAPKVMVTERFMREDGTRADGIWMQLLLVNKAEALAAGGLDNRFDDGYAYEDGDFVTTLIERGATFYQMETPAAQCPYHIPHERPARVGEIRAKYAKNHALYHSKHPVSLMAMYERGEVNGRKLKK